MESPADSILKLALEPEPVSLETPRGTSGHRSDQWSATADFNLWSDVFVQQKLPWGRFLQSFILHSAALALIWTVSISWIRQQKILEHAAFDRSSLVTYSPEEYLPPLDTGASEAAKVENGDPAYAKHPILSVPREADNRSQTLVVPPDLKLNHDVPLPNIVATGAIVPAVPLDATQAALTRRVAPDTQVIAPAPEVQYARDRVVQSALKSDIIAPPPEVTNRQARGLTGPETAIVEPPPELTQAKRPVGDLNIGPSTVVAPAPQLALSEQRSLAPRGKGTFPGGGMQPVGPPPSVTATSGSGSGGRLVALGIHPVAPTGPVAVPGGNRRGTFSANPQGRVGGAGTPDLAGSNLNASGAGARGNGSGASNSRNDGSLPAGLRVVGANSGNTAAVERNGHNSSSDSNGDGDGARETATLASPNSGSATRSGARVASPIAEDKITDVDREVFGGKRFYAMTLNMPNLNSSTGSWDIRFAELVAGRKEGDLLAPVATETSDPGYPLELIRANVHGMVTLYAVIHSDGKVGDIRVLNSPDDRLDSYAAKALARWKFMPAERAGRPVALEAVVKIPFKVRRNF